MALQNLGPYKLHDVIGRGGMGTVFRATDPETGADVAVKALAPTLTLDEHFRKRFESEIQALIKLDHPNIVRLLSYGQDEGNLYFAMELVKGKSLFALQKDGYQFNWREVLRIGLDVSAGLRHAHDRGIIHRDLKPGNLLRDNAGTTKITDFGIAKAFGNEQLTGEGNVLGTLDFMPPEQARGSTITNRSDLYSLGAVMYALLTRRPPFAGETIRETLTNMESASPPSITSVVPNVPSEIEAIILRLLARNPKDRIATAYTLTKRLIDIQKQLREVSEASTAIVSREKPTSFSGPGLTSVEKQDKTDVEKSTKVEGERNDLDATEHHVDKDATHIESVAIVEAKTDKKTIIEDDDDFEIVGSKTDYFSEVSDKERGVTVEEIDEPPKNVWPLALALAIVLILGVIGGYFAFRDPPAEQLYELIKAGESRPTTVSRKIDQFLKLYPNHERAVEVKRLQRNASAIQYRNRLAFQSNLHGGVPLFEMEQQFLDYTAKTDSDSYTKLLALVTIYSKRENLDERSQLCLDAAQTYLHRMLPELVEMFNQKRQEISELLDSVESADPEDAKKVYGSIIELYEGKPWAVDLVNQAKQNLASLQQ